jgi:hypothetical protein
MRPAGPGSRHPQLPLPSCPQLQQDEWTGVEWLSCPLGALKALGYRGQSWRWNLSSRRELGKVVSPKWGRQYPPLVM